MLIRKFQSEDLESLLVLFQDVVRTVGAKYYDAEQVEAWAQIDREVWRQSLSVNITYVALENDEIIGFGEMTPTGHLHHMFVHQHRQGRGVARLLFKKLEEEAKKLGLTEITTEASIIAMPLAKRQGFEVMKEQRKVHRGIEFINYVMHKRL